MISLNLRDIVRAAGDATDDATPNHDSVALATADLQRAQIARRHAASTGMLVGVTLTGLAILGFSLRR